MNHRRLCGLTAILCLFLSGCDSKDPLSAVKAGTAPKEQAAAPSTDATKAEEKPSPPKPDLDRNTIPTALRTDAYNYYGLANPKTMDVEIRLKPQSSVFTGTTTVHLNKVGKDSATFSAETTGSIPDQLGDEVVELRPDGVYAVTSDKIKVSTPMLELPASVAAGVRWNVDSVVGSDDQKSHWKLSFQCMGVKPVSLDGKTYQALFVSASGTMEVPALKGKQNADVTEKEWFLKDVGLIRSEIVQTIKGKPSVTCVMVWKPEQPTKKP